MASTSASNRMKLKLSKVNLNHYASSSYWDRNSYNLMSVEYNDMVQSIILDLEEKWETMNGEQFVIWNRDIIKRFIKQLKEGKTSDDTTTTNSFVAYIIENNLDDYQVIKMVSGEKLMKKKIVNDCIERKTVLAWEDSFGIVLQAHTGMSHCDEAKLFEHLSSKYVINKFLAQAITTVCYECRTAGKPNVICGAYLITGSTLPPDASFDALLVYQDLRTKFVQLRPISKGNREMDIVMELLKIFTDLGPPANLEVYDNIFFPVMDYFKTLLPHADIKVRLTENDDDKIKGFEYEMLDWMELNNSNNWAVGCFEVQWAMNNEKTKFIEPSPFQRIYLNTFCESDKNENTANISLSADKSSTK